MLCHAVPCCAMLCHALLVSLDHLLKFWQCVQFLTFPLHCKQHRRKILCGILGTAMRSTVRPCRYSKSQEAVDLMGKFKSLLDPNQILNPYKLLPEKNRLYQPGHSHNQQSSAVTR